jgi:hypothetical protein
MVLRLEVPRGQAVARNIAAETSRSSWLAFLDSDDVWFSTSLLARMNRASRHNANFCWSSFIHRLVTVDNQERNLLRPQRDLCCQNCNFPRSKSIAKIALDDHNITIPLTVVMTRSLFLSAGGFEPGLVCSEDWLLWRRAMAMQQCRIATLDEPAGYYNTYDAGHGAEPEPRASRAAGGLSPGHESFVRQGGTVPRRRRQAAGRRVRDQLPGRGGNVVGRVKKSPNKFATTESTGNRCSSSRMRSRKASDPPATFVTDARSSSRTVPTTARSQSGSIACPARRRSPPS